MSDAIRILEADHRKVESLFERYESSPSREVVYEICTELTVHAAIEEQVVYPVLDELPGGSELREGAEHEHQEVKDFIAEIQEADYDPERARPVIEQLVEGLTHHVQEEESEVLPRMRESLGEDRITQLGQELAAAKLEQMMAVKGLEELTRDELYELAQASEIEGRSDMDKDDLIKALQS